MKFNKLLFLCLFLCLFTFGCSKKREVIEYNKEVNTYTIEKSNIESKNLTFEYLKDDNIEVNNKNGMIELVNTSNLSTIKVYLYYEDEASMIVAKRKKDLTSDGYFDYNKEEIGNYTGWSVYYKNSSIVNYDISLKLTDVDNDNKVYVAYVKVVQSPLQTADMSFDTKEFVNSDDFMHLIDSIKLVDKVVEDESN